MTRLLHSAKRLIRHDNSGRRDGVALRSLAFLICLLKRPRARWAGVRPQWRAALDWQSAAVEIARGSVLRRAWPTNDVALSGPA
jgi:hypothetical protein